MHGSSVAARREGHIQVLDPSQAAEASVLLGQRLVRQRSGQTNKIKKSIEPSKVKGG